MKRYSVFVVALLMNAMLFSTTASAGNCAVPANVAELAAKAGQLMNKFRAEKGRRALTFDSCLQAAAQAHACDMATKGYFSHRGQDGSSPGRRVRRTSCSARKVGENIAAGQTSAQGVIQGWIKSPGHNKIMKVGRGYNKYAIGVVKSGKAYSHGYVWVLLVARGR